MTNFFLASALFYHNEGLCIIPVLPHDKRPAIPWEKYQKRCCTVQEIKGWFNNGHAYNLGIVHGPVSGNYVTIDIDHDNGIFNSLHTTFPALFAGRVEQSGSGEGFHIPLRVKTLPDFGIDTRRERPRGNRTWKTPQGHVNIRAQFCQTVVPPSIHPNGCRYRFLQKGEIVRLETLNPVIAWLDKLAPPQIKAPPRPRTGEIRAVGDGLVAAVLEHWDSALKVFSHFGIVGNTQKEKNGELRILGQGGLLISKDDPAVWYNFSDEFGGGIFEAWGWQRFGSAYDRKRHFRQVLLEMAQAIGIDVAAFYRQGDETRITRNGGEGSKDYWTGQYQPWEAMRS